MAVTNAKKARRDHQWDQAKRHLLRRRNELSNDLQPLDRGVNYFVLQLERMGIRTEWSCEGHPAGFYITFHATYEQALRMWVRSLNEICRSLNEIERMNL